MKTKREKILEASMAITAFVLVLFLVFRHNFFLYCSLVILFIAMTSPSIMQKPAMAWYKISEAIGIVSNAIINSVVYYLLLSPISIFRKLTRSHTDLNIKNWKHSKKSSFKDRDQIIKREDLENLF